MSELLVWKSRNNRRPLLLLGARQTGKTWLSEQFGEAEYSKVARIDFLRDNQAKRIFDGNFDTERLLMEIGIQTGVNITPGDTLIILDEVQECSRALTSLKYFCEDASEYHVIATGSYMGIAMHDGESYPVGKVDTMRLYPLSFLEFLRNSGDGPLAEMIASQGAGTVSGAFEERLKRQLKMYMFVGGMPAIVAEYEQSKNLREIRRLQQGILDDYDNDFSKHAPPRLLERLRQVWASLPAQLSKENRKFVYGVVRPGARARQFEECLQWLCDYGIAYRIPCVSAIRTPLKSYAQPETFKMFCFDTGLLGALSKVDAATVIDGSAIFTEFKGAMTEQYVCQQLMVQHLTPYYWAKENSRTEVDFVIETHNTVMPVEVKAELNLKAKSLKSAVERFGLQRSIRTSLAGYRDEGWVTNIPLWAIGSINSMV
ncbi:ATP-binding protein [Bifidobacterium crudilactis]